MLFIIIATQNKFNWTVALGENAAIDQLDVAWERRELEDELSVKTNGKTVKGTSQQWAANKNERWVMKRIFPEVVERAIYRGASKKFPYGTRTLVRLICFNLAVYLRQTDELHVTQTRRCWKGCELYLIKSFTIKTVSVLCWSPKPDPPPISRKKCWAAPEMTHFFSFLHLFSINFTCVCSHEYLVSVTYIIIKMYRRCGERGQGNGHFSSDIVSHYSDETCMLSDRETWLSPQDWNIKQPLLRWCWSLHPHKKLIFHQQQRFCAYVCVCLQASDL